MNAISVELALDALAERVNDPVVRVTFAGHVVFANAAFARDFGTAPATVGELAVDDNCRERLVSTLKTGGDAELPMFDASGRLKLVNVDAMRTANGYMVVLRPQLPETKLAGDVFIATASHELRTPLNAVLGFVQMLERGIGGPLTEKQRGYLASIHAGTELLAGIVGELLEVARDDGAAERVNEVRVDLAALVRAQRDLIRAAADARGVNLADDLPGEPLVVRADARKLSKAILDLLANAVRFTPSGGTVTVGLGRNAVGAIALWVSDQGTSQPAPRPETVFGPDHAYQRRAPGAGIALAIVRRYAEQHGGHLEITMTAEGAARATILLPGERADS
ncbi:MAG: HAMP domain-containing histidine kinase [Rhodospirillales bacterium]|nr:HAMP domain-containing histidine kinase [Rhodospirillales bacterium]